MTETSAPKSLLDEFISFLVGEGIVDDESARRARAEMDKVDLRFGKVALLEGFVTPEEINKILWVQREALDKKFGEVAIDLGIMTPDEVRKALELQRDEMFAFCQALILSGQIAPQTLFAILKGFLEKNIEEQIERRRLDRHAKISRSIRDVLKRITVVAPMPNTVAKLMEMLNDPDVDLTEVAKVISLDVGLTAMLIRLSNSAFYGLKSPVTTVSKAVTVMGIKKLKQLLLSSAVMESFKTLPSARLYEFWSHSMRVAQWSKEISQFGGKPETDEFFLAGFLHNIGELVIQQYFSGEFDRIVTLTSGRHGPVEAELNVMGCDHADVGSYLLSLWQLPPPTVQAAMLHNHPRVHLQQMTGITTEAKVVNMAVAVAGCLDDSNQFGKGMQIGQVVENYRSIVTIDYRKVTDMHDRVERAVSELMQYFK